MVIESPRLGRKIHNRRGGKMKRLWFGLILAVAGLACSDATGPAELNGIYEYRATDSSGTVLLIGQLDLTFHEDSTITGSWIIGWAPGADQTTEVGPQVGEGALLGLLSTDGTILDLNPNVADNNVLLSGAFDLETLPPGLVGEWTHSTLIGPVAAGLFTATNMPPLMN
jgi:hypothetical protein